MDELSVLKARVFILEKQLENTNAQLQEFIEAFEEHRRHSRPLRRSSYDPRPPMPEEFNGPVSQTLEDMEWDYNMVMGEEE